MVTVGMSNPENNCNKICVWGVVRRVRDGGVIVENLPDRADVLWQGGSPIIGDQEPLPLGPGLPPTVVVGR